MIFERGDDEQVSLLWGTSDSVTTAEIPAQSGCARLFDQRGLPVNSDGDVANTPLRTVGDNYLIRLPAVTHGKVFGGPTYILVETNQPCKATPPEGEASVICENGRAAGTDLWGYDADSGLASLSYACSPERTYDLSWTEPGRTYAGSVYIAPPKDGACTLTLTDERASESASERIGESAISRSAVFLYRRTILVYADGEPGRPLFIVHLVIVNCPPPPAYASA
jgi:hypothetical protein